MKKLLLLTFVLVSSILCYSQDFQPIKLGDQVEVFINFFHPDSIGKGHLMANDTIGTAFIQIRGNERYFDFLGIECQATYYLIEDTIERITYFTNPSYGNFLENYMDDNKEVTDYLSKKYDFKETSERWNNLTYKNKKDKIALELEGKAALAVAESMTALALANGHLILSTIYIDDDNIIIHVIRHSPSRIIYQIIDYSSKKYNDYYDSHPLSPLSRFRGDILRRDSYLDY